MQRWLAVGTLWLLAASAQAQVPASDKAAAEALFDRGRHLMRMGQIEEACTRFEQSNAIEHGIGTMLYLADCYERSGRTASAWALFREATSEAQAAGQQERAQAGRDRAARLEPVLSKLVIEVPEASRVAGLEVLRNDKPVPKGLWGEPLPVDPGEQKLEARAPGHLAHTQTVSVDKGPTTARVELPKLEPAPVEQTPVAAAPTTPEVAPPAPAPAATASAAIESAPAAERRRDGRTQRLVGLVLGGVGVAALAVGAGFGIRAIKKKSDSSDACDGKFCDPRDPAAFDARKSAWSATKPATAGFIVGGVLVASGLVTYLIAPKSDTRVAVSIDRQSASLGVGGVF